MNRGFSHFLVLVVSVLFKVMKVDTIFVSILYSIDIREDTIDGIFFWIETMMTLSSSSNGRIRHYHISFSWLYKFRLVLYLIENILCN